MNDTNNCKVCEKVFTSKPSLMGHMKTHKNILFVCGETSCGLVASSVKQFNAHQRTHELVCNYCEKRFTRKCVLTTHMESVHLKKYNFSCDICDKQFYRNNDYQTHLNTHKGIKKFPCTECEKTFGHISNLNRHTRTHTKEKPYICPDCGQRFTQSSTLVAHKKSHNMNLMFSCSLCNRKFLRSKQLNEHQKTAHGATSEPAPPRESRKFYCKICGKTFNFKVDLSRHSALFHKDSATCLVCGFSFSSASQLEGHECSQIPGDSSVQETSSFPSSIETDPPILEYKTNFPEDGSTKNQDKPVLEQFSNNDEPLTTPHKLESNVGIIISGEETSPYILPYNPEPSFILSSLQESVTLIFPPAELPILSENTEHVALEEEVKFLLFPEKVSIKFNFFYFQGHYLDRVPSQNKVNLNTKRSVITTSSLNLTARETTWSTNINPILLPELPMSKHKSRENLSPNQTQFKGFTNKGGTGLSFKNIAEEKKNTGTIIYIEKAAAHGSEPEVSFQKEDDYEYEEVDEEEIVQRERETIMIVGEERKKLLQVEEGRMMIVENERENVIIVEEEGENMFRVDEEREQLSKLGKVESMYCKGREGSMNLSQIYSETQPQITLEKPELFGKKRLLYNPHFSARPAHVISNSGSGLTYPRSEYPGNQNNLEPGKLKYIKTSVIKPNLTICSPFYTKKGIKKNNIKL